MKNKGDLVRGWFRKGDSDLANVRGCMLLDQCLDTACFHAQQAAEKYLKAYLTSRDVSFPFTHDLEVLIDICSEEDASFGDLYGMADLLTPYAVTLRYDPDFWPEEPTVQEALDAAETIREFVFQRLPEDMRP
jgi:HEPN domain-containing protein